MAPRRTPKSYWTPVSCSTEKDKVAIRSWFSGLADDLLGPTKASLLCRTEDDRELKLAALFTQQDGTPRELVRTNGRNFTVTIRPPTRAPWGRAP